MLTAETLTVLLAGQTHVIERNGLEAYVYFEPDGAAHMLLDDGETRSGVWRQTEGGYATEWDTGAKGDWAIEHQPGSLTYINRGNSSRMRLVGVLFGNAKDLPRTAAKAGVRTPLPADPRPAPAFHR